MGKRVKAALVVLAVALVGAIGWQVAQPSDEPTYQGKRLSEQLIHPKIGRPVLLTDEYMDRMRREEEASPRQMPGTNEIPTLLRLLQVKDSPLKIKLMDLVQKQHVVKIEFVRADQWHFSTLLGFAALGTNAQSAVPALIEIADQNIPSTSGECAIMALGLVGPPAKQAVPSLLRWATNAAPNVRSAAIDSLGEIGPSARAAVPSLMQWATNADTLMRISSRQSLPLIDPEAAAKAGITIYGGSPK